MTSLKDLIAGVFVLVALLLFLVFLGWASDIKAIFTERKAATVLLRRAVPQGASVRYEGILVGDVKAIRLRDATARTAAHPDYHVALELSLAPDVPLTEKTRVFVTANGLLGARFVDVRAAPENAPPLPAGTPLLGVLGGVDAMLSRMDELTASLTGMLDRLHVLLDPNGARGSVPHLVGRVSDLTDEASKLVQGLEGTRGQVDAGLAEARKLVTDVQPGVKDLMTELASVSGEARAALADLRGVVGENRGPIRQLVSDGAAALARLTATMDRTLARVDGLIVRNDRNIFLTLHHLRVAAEELKLAVARVRADPSQVLWGGAEDPDAAEAAAKKSQERDLLDKGFLPPRWKR